MFGYMLVYVDIVYLFRDEMKWVIDENIVKMEMVYIEVVMSGDVVFVKWDLRFYLWEYVVWERNIVWRDLIGIEWRVEVVRIG